jgi:hypothetical protein
MTSLGLFLPLPGNFNTEIIAQGIFLTFATLLFLTRRLPMHRGISELEVWCVLLILTVVQAYLRAPVGLNIFGSDSVGAMPYAVFAVSSLCALVLSTLSLPPQDLRLWVRLSFIGSIMNFTIGAIAFAFPQAGAYLGASFSVDTMREENSDGAGRIIFVRDLSISLATWISSRISPLRAIFHPLWGSLILVSLALAALSGFRSVLIHVCLMFLIGICYRGGVISVLAALFTGASGLALLAFVNVIAPLPINTQRALSFLPGTWDETTQQGAEESTEWRVEMWKEALLTEKWIRNKWLGDGLGFTKEELARMLNIGENRGNYTGITGLTLQQESMMTTGDYHSGPVQTIRTTGYVGLAVMLLAMIRNANRAHRQILRSKNTEWFPVALFLGIPIVALPIFWTFVFGTFASGSTAALMGAAIVRLMEKNLPLPVYTKRRRGSFILNHDQSHAESPAPSR